MDHYADLLVAHVHNGGGRKYADEIELQALTHEQGRNVVGSQFISGLPADIDVHSCVARAIGDAGIVWSSLIEASGCKCCDGEGEIPARGYDGRTRYVECPDCLGDDPKEPVRFLTDRDGEFITILPNGPDSRLTTHTGERGA